MTISMQKALFLLALAAAFAAAPAAYACSPAPSWPPSMLENLAQKDVAFVGTVTGVIQDRSVNGDYRVTLSVDEEYKGELGDTVTVRTRSSSAACGYDDGYDAFEKGAVWSIFANGSEDEGYHTDSLSLNASHKSVEDAVRTLSREGLQPLDDDADEPVMCTMQYAPVCGKLADGSQKTFGNACVLGAEKAEYLHDGECKAGPASLPAANLSLGMRGADVTQLQEYLITAAKGAAAKALESVGATGDFGELTRSALAELQRALSVEPAQGFFGPLTRAALSTTTAPAPTAVFRGEVEAVDTGCFADGICSVTVGGKEVIILAGFRISPPPVGTLQGVDSIGGLENEIGSEAEVYAAVTTEGDADYTLYGSLEYYVKVLKD
jgi:hypothetical protein